MALITGSGSSLGGISGGSAAARLLVVISGDSSQLTAALTKAGASTEAFGQTANKLGSALTLGVTLPLLALGGYAVKSASDFQSSMARVAGLTPILDSTGKSIGQLSQELLDMSSTDVPATAKELADSLYFAGSAGLNAATAMQVVKFSAQGAAIGMGDANDISRVLIAALNNYGPAGLTASHAMDVLTAGIIRGTAAPDEMAIALGRLLPVANAAGVSFDNVVASVAQLTNLGVPTRVATTSLRALFSELLAPTQAATEKLNEFGISAGQLRSALDAGPIPAFKLLEDATHGNVEALHDIIPQIRGFTAFLGLTGDNAKKTSVIFEAVKNSTGDFGRALAQIAKTPAFKFQIAMNKLNAAAISLGDHLLPVFLKLVQILGDVGSAVAHLPSGVQTFFAGLLLAGAAVGPLLKLGAALTSVTNVAGEGSAFVSMAPTFKAIATGFITAGVAALVAYGSFKSLADGSTSLVSVALTLVGTIITVKLALAGLQAAANAGVLGVNELSLAISGMSGGALTAVALGIGAIVTVLGLVLGSSSRAAEGFHQIHDSALEAAKGGQTVSEWLKGLSKENETAAASITKLVQQLHLMQQPTGVALPKILGGTTDALTSGLIRLQGALKGTSTQAGTASGNLQKMIPILLQATSSGQALGPALEKAGFSMEELNSALSFLAEHGASDALSSTAAQVQQLAGNVPALSSALRDYDQSQQAAILASNLSSEAVDAMAKKYGVSSDFMQSQLDGMGVSAVGMSSTTQDAFARSAFGVDKFGNTVSGKMAEAAAAVDKSSQEMSDSLTQAFTLFGDLPDKATGSMDQLITKAGQLSDVAVQQAQDIQKLQTEGVPTGLINQAIAAGPATLNQFASASKSQLKQLVVDYQVGLAALDAEILKEGAHQEVKGKSLVEGFTTAILGSSSLPQAAAQKITKDVTTAFAKGDVSKAGVKMVQEFVTGLGHVKGASKQQGAKAAQYFAQAAIQGGKGISRSGQIDVQRFAQGMSQALNIPLRVAKQMVSSVTSGLKKGADQAPKFGGDVARRFGSGVSEGKGQATSAGKAVATGAAGGMKAGIAPAHSTGTSVGNAFASGLRATAPQASAAGHAVAAAAAQGLHSGSQNSPKYFTYYHGQELVNQLAEGMASRSRYLTMKRPKIKVDMEAEVAAGVERALARMELHVTNNTYLDSKHIERAHKRKEVIRR